MNRSLRVSTALTALAAATLVGGCAGPAAKRHSLVGSKVDAGNIGLATRAQMALATNRLGEAVDLAERAVANTPGDSSFRALLGNTYLASGRYVSAEAAYRDSLALAPNQPQVALKLALVTIALGRRNEAGQLLDTYRSAIDPADYGLAMALIGRPGEAVEVLELTARQPGADSRVRQNLALAYALAGNWTQARNVAAQDVPADQLDARIQQWMTLANPARPHEQVAALIGVAPAADAGIPVRLALTASPVRHAEVAPPPVAAPVEKLAAAKPLPAAAADPLAPPVAAADPVEPVAVAKIPAAAPAPAPELPVAPPIETAAIIEPEPSSPANPGPMPAPAVPAVPAAAVVPAVAPAEAAPVAAEIRTAADSVTVPLEPLAPPAAPVEPPAKPLPVRPIIKSELAAEANRSSIARSKLVVQLGAYGSPRWLPGAWAEASARHSALRAYVPVTARFASPHGTVYRLSVSGFSSNREAIKLCRALREAKASCFVRTEAGDSPVKLAQR